MVGLNEQNQCARGSRSFESTLDCPTRFFTFIGRYSQAAYTFSLTGSSICSTFQKPAVALVEREIQFASRSSSNFNKPKQHPLTFPYFLTSTVSPTTPRRQPFPSNLITHLPFKTTTYVTDALHPQRAGCEPPSWTSTLCS